MARTPDEIVDETPLTGTKVDVPARIGWLLRTARSRRGVSLRDLSGRMSGLGAPHSPATLSRMETTGVRSGRLLDLYERALELPYGSLRAPVEILCHTFSFAPPDHEPVEPPETLAEFSDAWAVVAHGEPTGADWLRFSDIQLHSRHGLPLELMRPLVARLVGELGRSVAQAYTTRYVALTNLRCSDYSDLVFDEVRATAEAPYTQLVVDAMHTLTYLPTPEIAAWLGQLLLHPRMQVMRAAAMSLQSLRAVGYDGEDEWAELIPPFLEAYRQSAPGSSRRGVLTSLHSNAPKLFRARVLEALDDPLEPAKGPVDWAPRRTNPHLAVADQLASRACDLAGLEVGQPLLARMLFEMLYDFRSTRSYAAWLVTGAAGLGPYLQQGLLDAARSGPDLVTRRGATTVLWRFAAGLTYDELLPLLEDEDLEIRQHALVISAHAAVPIPLGVLRNRLDGDEVTRNWAFYSLGMSRNPDLASVAEDPQFGDEARGAARWWMEIGGAIWE